MSECLLFFGAGNVRSLKSTVSFAISQSCGGGLLVFFVVVMFFLEFVVGYAFKICFLL